MLLSLQHQNRQRVSGCLPQFPEFHGVVIKSRVATPVQLYDTVRTYQAYVACVCTCNTVMYVQGYLTRLHNFLTRYATGTYNTNFSNVMVSTVILVDNHWFNYYCKSNYFSKRHSKIQKMTRSMTFDFS